MNETPIYISQPSFKNLWNEYRVYPDRLELKVHIYLRTFVIPLSKVVDISVSGPLALQLLKRDTYRGGLPLKLDLTDFYNNVALRRSFGLMRQLRFTPDDPEAFVAACRQALEERTQKEEV